MISRMEPYVTSRASFVPDPPRHPPSIVSECVGCESIKHCELEAVKNDLAPHATVLYEKLEADTTRFTDPLAYLFLAPPADGGGGSGKLVVLVQFKTYAITRVSASESYPLTKSRLGLLL